MKSKFNGLKRIRINQHFNSPGDDEISEEDKNFDLKNHKFTKIKRNTLMDQLEEYQDEIELENKLSEI